MDCAKSVPSNCCQVYSYCWCHSLNSRDKDIHLVLMQWINRSLITTTKHIATQIIVEVYPFVSVLPWPLCLLLASLYFSLFKKKKRPCTCFFAEINEYNSEASNHLKWRNQFLGLLPNLEQVHASIKENKNGLLPAPKLPLCFLLLSAPQARIVPKIAASSGTPGQIC